MQTLTYSGSLAKECISFINKKQQPGTMWKDIIYFFIYEFVLFFFIYSTINITHNAMSPTHDDLCSPSQTLYAWPSRHHVPWVPRRRQSWLRSPSQNASPVSAPHTKKMQLTVKTKRDVPWVPAPDIPQPLRLAHLRKESLAGSWRAVHEDVPVQAVVLPCVPCRDGNVTHALLEGGLSDLKIYIFFL